MSKYALILLFLFMGSLLSHTTDAANPRSNKNTERRTKAPPLRGLPPKSTLTETFERLPHVFGIKELFPDGIHNGVLTPAQKTELRGLLANFPDKVTGHCKSEIEYIVNYDSEDVPTPVMSDGNSARNGIGRGFRYNDPVQIEEGLAAMESAKAGGRTARPDEAELLHWAAMSGGSHRYIKRLINLGLDLNLNDSDVEALLWPRECTGHKSGLSALHWVFADLNPIYAVDHAHSYRRLPTDKERLTNLKTLLKAGADPNVTTAAAGAHQGGGGVTPLMLAASWDSPFAIEAVGMLLDACADPNISCEGAMPRYSVGSLRHYPDGDTALSIAKRVGNHAVATLLQQSGARISDVEVKQALLNAATHRDVQQILSSNPDSNIDHGDVFAHALLDHPRDPNLPAILIEGGLDPNAILRRYFRRGLPLLQAVVSNEAIRNSYSGGDRTESLHLIRTLVKKGADVNHRDPTGLTPLLNLANAPGQNGYLDAECAKILIENGADVNAVSLDRDGDTPLIRAMLTEAGGTVEALLQYGAADVNAVNNRGVSALEIAIRRNRPVDVKRLMDSGAQLDTPRIRALLQDLKDDPEEVKSHPLATDLLAQLQ